jgi:ABC-type sugar transport system ATPase subunit
LNKSGPELSFTGEVFNTQEQVMSNSSRDRWEKKKEKGTAILLVLEDLEDIFRIADRVAVMYQGSISGILEVNKTSIEEIGSLMVGAQLTGVENG